MYFGVDTSAHLSLVKKRSKKKWKWPLVLEDNFFFLINQISFIVKQREGTIEVSLLKQKRCLEMAILGLFTLVQSILTFSAYKDQQK